MNSFSDSDSDSEQLAIQQYESQHKHHSFLSKVEGVALDIGKGVVTEGIVGLL